MEKRWNPKQSWDCPAFPAVPHWCPALWDTGSTERGPCCSGSPCGWREGRGIPVPGGSPGSARPQQEVQPHLGTIPGNSAGLRGTEWSGLESKTSNHSSHPCPGPRAGMQPGVQPCIQEQPWQHEQRCVHPAPHYPCWLLHRPGGAGWHLLGGSTDEPNWVWLMSTKGVVI